MTINEAGVIAGIPAGAIVGALVGNVHEVYGIAGGFVVGLVSGSVAGWLYAYLIICMLSVFQILWRAAQKRESTVVTEADIASMNPIAIRGTIIGVFAAAVCWIAFGWLQALLAALTIGVVATFVAVARCELR